MSRTKPAGSTVTTDFADAAAAIPAVMAASAIAHMSLHMRNPYPADALTIVNGR
jgi:hypothetical protein